MKNMSLKSVFCFFWSGIVIFVIVWTVEMLYICENKHWQKIWQTILLSEIPLCMSVNSTVSFLYRNESRGYLHKMSSKVLVVPYFLGILRGVIICVGFPLFSPPKEDVPKNLISCRCLLVPYWIVHWNHYFIMYDEWRNFIGGTVLVLSLKAHI